MPFLGNSFFTVFVLNETDLQNHWKLLVFLVKNYSSRQYSENHRKLVIYIFLLYTNRRKWAVLKIFNFFNSLALHSVQIWIDYRNGFLSDMRFPLLLLYCWVLWEWEKSVDFLSWKIKCLSLSLHFYQVIRFSSMVVSWSELRCHHARSCFTCSFKKWN